MPEYTYNDFLENLDAAGRRVAEALYGHIAANHGAYQAYGILPKDKTKKEWSLHFRKHPKHGKPLCSLFADNGVLSIRFLFYSEMVHELLLRQEEFGEQIRAGIVQACRCSHCGCHGDIFFCWLQHHYCINGELLYSCNTAWYTIENISEGSLSDSDLADLRCLADLQAKHMTHSARESRGAGYGEGNVLRCGNPELVTLEYTALDIDVFDPADYADTKRLEKYSSEYHFTPMGAHNGLWCYLDEQVLCGTPNERYALAAIPGGQYAGIAVSDPFAFSAVRAWDYLCLWARKNSKTIRPIDLGGVKTPQLVRFFKQEGAQLMGMYVLITEEA